MSVILKLWDPRKPVDIDTYDFSDLDEGEGKASGDYDFLDIDDGEFPHHDRLAIEYNFGEPEKSPYYIVPRYLRDRLIPIAIQDVLIDGTKYDRMRELLNPLVPMIIFQMYYNISSNKCFMEFRFSKKLRYYINTTKLKAKINGFINANFKYDLGYIPEIIMLEDGVDERCDSLDKLTPYTIGYWKSLSGQYEFVEDETRIQNDLRQFNVNDYGEAFNKEKSALYQSYLNGSINYSTYWTNLKALYAKYNVNPDQKPRKAFTDFIKIVEDMVKKYSQTYLTEAQKTAYINEYTEIFAKYEGDEYKQKMLELDEKYNIKTDINSKIPEIFDEYYTEYKKFFNTELDEIYKFARQYFYSLHSF